MDLKAFMLLNGSRLGPVWAGFETPTSRSRQIMHCPDISQQTRAEFPTQKVRHDHLTPARSRLQMGLVVLVRPFMRCKVERMARTVYTTGLQAVGSACSGFAGEESPYLIDITQKFCLRFIAKVYVCRLPPYLRYGGSHPRLLRTQWRKISEGDLGPKVGWNIFLKSCWCFSSCLGVCPGLVTG